MSPALLTASPARRVLVVDDDVMIRELVKFGFEAQGHHVETAGSGAQALSLLESVTVDLVISDIMMPGMDGFALVTKLRTASHTRTVPVIFLTSRIDPTDAATGLRLSAADYVRKPFDVMRLVEQAGALLAQPSRAVDRLLSAPTSTILSRGEFVSQIRLYQASRRGRFAIAVIDIDERAALRARFGPFADHDLAARIVSLLGPAALVGMDSAGRLLLMVDHHSDTWTKKFLRTATAAIGHESFSVAGEHVTVTPIVGWAALGPKGADADVTVALDRAATASLASSWHLDLQPVAWDPSLETAINPSTHLGWWRRFAKYSRTAWQIAATFVLGLGVPLALYLTLYNLGIDLFTWFYAGVVVALVVTGLMIWIEGFNALDPERPPALPSRPAPPATAIIAAYLPNEAATIVGTVESFLRVDYSQLQVIVAYNTPRGYLVERTLRDIAARDSRLLPLRVEGSSSKAQNVKAALRHATGEVGGVFDADHHPDPGSFHRAWRWLSNGYDVVQGHCVIRNGDASWVSRTVAVEFEAIYAVSHPGRNRLHGFGVFGGSNGFWRTDLLRATRMHGFMLTEDIDSSLRVVGGGARIANDPALISRELAPVTVESLWNQRMRWAQGWFQVSRKHLLRAWGSKVLTMRQKAGMTFLLGWREIYPWISIQMVPLLTFLAWREGGVNNISWLIALFVLTTLFTFSVGPGQVLFAHRLAAPEVRRRREWFWHYLWIASFFYTEWKNIIARVAQFKELTGERQWKVTPRAATASRERP